MTAPRVKLDKLDNQIGVSVPSDDILAAVGNCVGGTLAINTPTIFARKQDVINACGQGRLCENLCLMIEHGLACVGVRTDFTTAATMGTIDTSGVTGTSVVTNGGGAAPVDDFDVVVTITTGFTVGIIGGMYTYSLDGGLTTSLPQAVGTLTSITLPGSIGVVYAMATGNLVAGDVIKSRTTAALWNDTQLAAALTSLQNTAIKWDLAHILGPCTPSDAAQIETSAAAMESADKERTFIYSCRTPNVGESDSTYQASIISAFASTTALFSSICAGETLTISPISNNRYRRPSGWAIAYACAKVDAGTDPAWVDLGSLPVGFQITDDTGNPKYHDEFIMPGLDDQHFSTLRTWANRKGTYVCNARIFSTPTSDFQFIQHRRVMNKTCTTVRLALESFSSKGVTVDKTTGFIKEYEARDIETSVNSATKRDIIDRGFASACLFTLSRSDNLLSTFKLNGQERVTPLAYLKQIESSIGFYNPALAVTQV